MCQHDQLPILFVPHHSVDVYWNFGLESYFVEQKRLTDHSVFLLWRTTPTLMLGRYQNALAEINPQYVEEHGVHLVRRMSGGGTIYTDLGGWQFSFIQPQSEKEIEFIRFIKPVVAALNHLGIPASFNGRNDLVVDGKKFSGNAQYKQDGFVVHHGSLLFDTDLEAIVKSTTVPDIKLISKGIQSVRERVCNLKDYLPEKHKGMTAEDFGEYMAAYLAGCDGRRDEVPCYILSEEEKAVVARLGEEKYKNPEAVWGRNPAFSIVHESRFAGGHVRLLLNVDKGCIAEARLEGDYFASGDTEAVMRGLCGIPYTRESVLHTLRESGFDGCIYLVSSEDVASLIPQLRT